DLLGERALLGDMPARNALAARVIRPLVDSPGRALLETAAAWLDGGLGVEGTARALIVHPNTVRYRLAGITKAIGYDLTDPHDAQTVRTALAFHRLGPASRTSPRP
ncbi:MAG TPA: helix-turn-helix domain-containing protein, partial [Phycicoccus sp.]|nr:helix-turn-helix domain-containing protein [Phycicoccus sp.]